MSKINSASKIKVNTFEDLFGMDDSMKSTDKRRVVREIPIDELHEFKNHPFKLKEEKVCEIADSIKQHGVLVPGICRMRPMGGYEIIAGHTRKAACEKEGLSTMPMVVRNLRDDEAIIAMVDSNLQREDVLVSEKARAYKMRYDAMKNYATDGNSLNTISGETGENAKKIQRYIWLARLNDDFLDMVDDKKLGLVQGVDLSFLTSDEQDMLFATITDYGFKISTAQAAALKDKSKNGGLSEADILKIFMPKPVDKKKRKIVFKEDCLNSYFPDNYSDDEIMNVILELLDRWKEEGERGVQADE